MTAHPSLGAFPSDAAKNPALVECALPEIDEPLRCASIVVPENPDKPRGRAISLNVVVVPALSPEARTDPWVELVGGPGNAATDFARSFTTSLRYLRRDRDVLLIDQRGTGKSNGLYCEELALHRVSSLFPRWPEESVRACRERLARTSDLSQYSTRNAARDIEAVRVRLGYGKLNLFGSSYGTRLALDYMRQYPDHVRSAMLWGVVAPDFRRPLYYARDGQQAFDLLAADCKADPACFAAYPDPHADLEEAMAHARAQKRALDIVNPADEKTHGAALSPEGFAQGVWLALSYPDQARRLPRILHAAASGDFVPFLDLDTAKKPPRRRYYNAMHLSVVCPEETSRIGRGEIRRAYRGSFMPVDRAEEYAAACRIWSLKKAPKAATTAVSADIPTLIVSGRIDPITPPAWGEAVHRALPNSRHLVVRHLSHESDGLIGVECLDQLFEDFVANPDPAALDASCIDQISPPAFTVEGSTQP